MHHTDIGSIIIFLKLVCLEQTLADPGLSFGGQIEGRKEPTPHWSLTDVFYGRILLLFSDKDSAMRVHYKKVPVFCRYPLQSVNCDFVINQLP